MHDDAEGGVEVKLRADNYPEGRTVKRGLITADDIRKKFNLPANAEITVRIPGGGNWSGLDANLGEDIPHIGVKVETIR